MNIGLHKMTLHTQQVLFPHFTIYINALEKANITLIDFRRSQVNRTRPLRLRGLCFNSEAKTFFEVCPDVMKIDSGISKNK